MIADTVNHILLDIAIELAGSVHIINDMLSIGPILVF